MTIFCEKDLWNILNAFALWGKLLTAQYTQQQHLTAAINTNAGLNQDQIGWQD